ncbi:hypothetical protein, partial [uncultured Bacteroides sp.]|uniref:hypothetical protein n=1 Tax=uncultured Bacteroides sp. TaxID=162156 RepID=UPI002591DDCE
LIGDLHPLANTHAEHTKNIPQLEKDFFPTGENNIVHIQLRPLQVKKIPYHFHPKCNPLRSCDTGKYE